MNKPDAEQKHLLVSLDKLSALLAVGYRAPNDNSHRFELSGWLLLRAGVAMIEHGDRAFSLAADWCARGFPASTGGEPGGNGATWKVTDEYGWTDSVPVTSTEAAAIESDEWEKQRDQLGLLRKWLDDNARDIESRIAHTIRVAPNEGRRDSLIECANRMCETTMTGLGEDRPKDGRCPRCYQFRRRNQRDWTPNGLDVAS